MNIYSFLLLCILMTASGAAATESETVIGKFSSSDLTGWKDQTIWGANKSTYAFVQDNGRTVLQGKSTDAASGLLYKIDIDPKLTPIIKWSWKIDHTVKKGNERTKDGHDFAVRLYVVFPRGLFSSHRAIEYVWGNVLPRGDMLPSPYSKNAVMIVVDSGNELAGKWTFHKRNFYEDYKLAFGEEPPKVGAIALMTDSDNTHESVTGYFGDITLVAVPAKPENQKQQKDNKVREVQPKDGPGKEVPAKDAPGKDLKHKEQKQKELTVPQPTTVKPSLLTPPPVLTPAPAIVPKP